MGKTACKLRSLLYFPRSFMAKTSWINRNNRKRDTVKKYAALRAELKAKKDYAGLSALAARCQPDASRQSLRGERPPPRLYSPIQDFASHFSRTGLRRVHPGRDEVELVALR